MNPQLWLAQLKDHFGERHFTCGRVSNRTQKRTGGFSLVSLDNNPKTVVTANQADPCAIRTDPLTFCLGWSARVSWRPLRSRGETGSPGAVKERGSNAHVLIQEAWLCSGNAALGNRAPQISP